MVVFERATGRRLERWPVDARAMLASGDCTATPLEDGAGADPTADAAPQPPAAEAPAFVDVPSASSVHPLGVPLVVTRAHDAAPSQPFAEPVRTARKGGRR